MIILGIDTSCDDTAISVIEIPNPKSQIPNFKILSNIVSSQVKLHAKYGGVYPFLAKREHRRNLPVVFNKALRKAGFANPKSEARNPKQIQNSKFKIQNLDMIAVTNGPGLEPCLWQGVNFAKEIAQKIKKPLIPINHIEAHILANFLPSSNLHDREFFRKFKKILPAICLVVSGGHTVLFSMREIGKYKLIGETRDDAAGECFDKVARILGLGYPGGPVIDAAAAKFKISNFKFKIELPRPMIYQKNYDFSFSGLKTAVLYDFKSRSLKVKKSKEYIQEMSAEAQQAIIDVLIKKTLRAAKDYRAKAIVLGGGVAASQELRKQFKVQSLRSKVNFLVPPKNFCTDNAAMIAVTAYFHQKEATKNWQKIKVNANLKI